MLQAELATPHPTSLRPSSCIQLPVFCRGGRFWVARQQWRCMPAEETEAMLLAAVNVYLVYRAMNAKRATAPASVARESVK